MKQSLIVGAVAATLALPVQAASLFTDLATFQASTGATAEPALPNLGFVGVGPETVGSLTFSKNSQNFAIGTAGSAFAPDEFSSLIVGNEIGISGPENLTIKAANPLTALGFFIHEPIVNTGTTVDSCNATCEDSTFRLELYSGASLIDQVAFDPALNAAVFIGVSSGTAFDRVELIDVTGGIDNEFVGEFYTAVVPLPAGLWLMLGGLGLLGLARRRWAAG